MKSKLKEIIGKVMLNLFGLKKSLQIYYKLKTGLTLDLENPLRYSEKIQVRKLKYKENKLYSICADKYKVREYVKNKIGEKYLIPLYFAKETIDSSDINLLPSSFVLKTNNASKTNIIVNDKKTINVNKIVHEMNKYVKYKFGYRTFELFYNEIKPLIIAEKYMGTINGDVPNDYKFYCFKQKNNKTKILIQADKGRYTSNHYRAYFDDDWIIQPYGNNMGESSITFKKPKLFNDMIRIAKKLSEDFDYVRVDLYEVDSKIYFGELTFTDGSGYDILKPDKYDIEWGKYWE